MTASADQAEIPLYRQIENELNQPSCPVYDSDCRYVGTLPRDEAIARANEAQATGASGSSCAASPSGSDTFLAASFGLVGLALTRAVRRRRR